MSDASSESDTEKESKKEGDGNEGDKQAARKRRKRRKAAEIQEMIQASLQSSLSTVMEPLQRQIQSLSRPVQDQGGDYGVDIRALREKQQLLDIETKAASMKTAGAQSQYCVMAGIKLHVTNASALLDDIMLTLDSPEEPMYRAIETVKEVLGKAEAEAGDRISLLFKADEEPKYGWRALSLMEEKKRQGSTDPETEKLFASCVKQVQESAKKPKLDASSSKRPFSQGPGWYPGVSATG